MKKTTNQIIRDRRIRKISVTMNGALRALARILYYKPYSVKFIRHVEPNDYKNKPLMLVVNHASRFDYAFVQGVMRKRRINFVAAEQEFHRTKFKTVFTLGRLIPKKSFVPDVNAIKGMTRIIRNEKNGCIAIFPCGLSTVSGAQQPSMLGTGKMLKHFGVTVLAVRIHGAYLACPKFDLKERKGHVEVELDELFTPEQLAELDSEEIERKVDEAIFTDDYDWNASRQNAYFRKDGKYAENMEQILYKCPMCGTEMEMRGHDNVIECKHCGNGATLDDRFNLVPIGDSVIPCNPREWYDWERREMRRAVADPDFAMEENVILGVQPRYGYVKHGLQTYDVGKGKLRVDRSGLKYVGTRDGKDWGVFIPREAIPTTIINMDASFISTFASGEFLMFTPDRYSAIRLNFAIEEIYRINGGKWQNFPWFDYDKRGFEPYKTEK